VKINERTLAVLLSSEGKDACEAAALGVPATGMLWVYAEDSDDMGLWIRVGREDGDHLALIRWEYVLLVDFPAGEPKAVGIR